MFIAQSTINLKDIKIFDKFFNFTKGKRFIARDGLLYDQIKAGNIKIVAESSEIQNASLTDYIVFESQENKNVFNKILGINSITPAIKTTIIKKKTGAVKQCKKK